MEFHGQCIANWLLWVSTVGYPSDSLASCHCWYAVVQKLWNKRQGFAVINLYFITSQPAQLGSVNCGTTTCWMSHIFQCQTLWTNILHISLLLVRYNGGSDSHIFGYSRQYLERLNTAFVQCKLNVLFKVRLSFRIVSIVVHWLCPPWGDFVPLHGLICAESLEGRIARCIQW